MNWISNIGYRKICVSLLALSLVVSAAIAIWIFIFGSFGELQMRLLATTIGVSFYSLMMLCSLTLYEKKGYVIFSVAGVLVAVLGFAQLSGLIWGDMSVLSDTWRWQIMFIIMTFSTAHASLLLIAKTVRYITMSIQFATLVCIFVVALMLSNIVLSDSISQIGDSYYRTLGTVAVLDVLGTLLLPILQKLMPSKGV